MPMENYGSVYKNIPEDGAVDNLNLARDDESVDDYESEKDSFPLRVKLFYFNSELIVTNYIESKNLPLKRWFGRGQQKN